MNIDWELIRLISQLDRFDASLKNIPDKIIEELTKNEIIPAADIGATGQTEKLPTRTFI